MRAAVVLVLALGLGCAAEPPPAAAWQWQLPAGFPAPRLPAGAAMSAARVELGRHLFHDRQLSATATQACADCHQQARAFTDGRATTPGATGEPGRRSAMSLANVAYAASLTWADPALTTLEAQARVPLLGAHPVELGASEAVIARLADDATYAALFADAFDEPPSVARVADALAAFQRTLISGDAAFDRRAREPLDPAAARGLALFESPRLGCTRCHGGFAFTAAVAPADPQLFATGLDDDDDDGLAEHTGDPADRGRFKPPTLRNIAVTGPYFHDGRIATLDGVLDHYAAGAVGPAFVLTAAERAELHALFAALTDHAFLADPRFASPW